MLNQPALKIGQNLRMAELEGEHFNGMLFIIFSGCSPLAAQSACLKMTFFQWSRPFHTILAWFLTYHLEVFMAYIYIYSDILSGIIWHLFRHSVWHPFWNSFWHLFWHSFWHLLGHSFWHLLGHSFWHLFWHLFWHAIWHLFWHSF